MMMIWQLWSLRWTCSLFSILEDLLSNDIVTGNLEDEVIIGDCSQVDVSVKDLAADPDDWSDQLQDLGSKHRGMRSVLLSCP